jgi:hypothetical protein
MKRGPKPELPSTKLARGTFQECRDGGRFEDAEPAAVPMQPDWLTDAGKEVWLDDLSRVIATKLVTERDSTMFANYCNLQGAINLCWRSNEVPPAAHLTESRKLAEQFGILGRKSRSQAASPDGETKNPFSRNGKKPG